CLLVPAIVGLVDAWTGAASDGLRLAVVALSCAVASGPLGASLPAAVRVLDPPPGRTASTLARLYAANTAGAVLGVAWPTAFAFEDVGTRAVVTIAAGGQALVAVLATATLR